MPIAVYKNDILISEPRLARTQLEKARGLMFSRFHDVLFHFPEEERLKFHMVFVFYAIDIIFMDSDMRVVDLKPRFRPFTVYYSKACSSTVLETYNGFIAEHDIAIGDQLTITHDGEIPMTQKKHRAETTMLHTTSLGAMRTARTEPVRVNEERAIAPEPKRTARTAPKKSAPKTPARTSTKKTGPKRSASKTKTPAKKPAKRTDHKKRSTPQAPARTSTKKTGPKRSAAKKSSTVAKRSVKKKAASKQPARKRAK